MKITIIGAKVIGGTLARKWVAAGHTLAIGVRNTGNPEVQKLVRELGENASLHTVDTAIASGDVVVFAIPGSAMEETIKAHGRLLRGKIVIDAANKTGGKGMNSAAEFAQYAPGAKVFRAFNNLGWENFDDPRFGETVADLLYCGPGDASQAVMERLIEDIGLRPIRLGDLDKVHLADSVAEIWFALVFGQRMGRRLAFKVLTK